VNLFIVLAYRLIKQTINYRIVKGEINKVAIVPLTLIYNISHVPRFTNNKSILNYIIEILIYWQQLLWIRTNNDYVMLFHLQSQYVPSHISPCLDGNQLRPARVRFLYRNNEPPSRVPDVSLLAPPRSVKNSKFIYSTLKITLLILTSQHAGEHLDEHLVVE